MTGIIIKWINAALQLPLNKQNKRRIYELINLLEVLNGGSPAQVKMAYNFVITLNDNETVRELVRILNEKLR